MFALKKNLLMTMAAVLVIGWALPSYADDLDAQLQNEINSYVSQYAAAEGFTAVQLSVLLPNESAPRDYVFGVQIKDDATPATTDMMTQWGSITKEFTNLLLFQYLNEHPGSFSLDTTVVEMLPEQFAGSATAWPAVWKNVTIKQLMNMTSGITEYAGSPAFNPEQVTDLASLVNIAANYQNSQGCQIKMGCFPAGQQWFYSNTNYIILGMMIEKLYGTHFADVIEQQVLQTMQQQGNSVIYQTSYTPAILANMIHGYCTTGLEPLCSPGQDTTNMSLNWAASAGALTGNMHALVETLYALFHDQFLPPAQMHQFLNRGWVRMANGAAINDINSQAAQQLCTEQYKGCYGLGFILTYDPTYGQVWSYLGGTLGFTTYYMWIPQENAVIAFSINGSNGSVVMTQNFKDLNAQLLKSVYEYLHPGNSENLSEK